MPAGGWTPQASSKRAFNITRPSGGLEESHNHPKLFPLMDLNISPSNVSPSASRDSVTNGKPPPITMEDIATVKEGTEER